MQGKTQKKYKSALPQIMVLVAKWRDHGVAIESDVSLDRHAVGRTEPLTLCVPKRESIGVAVAE